MCIEHPLLVAPPSLKFSSKRFGSYEDESNHGGIEWSSRDNNGPASLHSLNFNRALFVGHEIVDVYHSALVSVCWKVPTASVVSHFLTMSPFFFLFIFCSEDFVVSHLLLLT